MPNDYDLNSFLASPNRYTSLSLYSKNISDRDCIKIADALKNNKTITSLDLKNNQIGEVGASALAEILKTNASLTELWLENNQIGDVGASALGKALKTNARLTHLDLRNNQIADAGASALAEILKINGTLYRLYLNNNQIGDAGASALADELKTNASLNGLNLRNNQIGDVGASALAKMLKTNASLEELYLNNNQIGNAGASALREAWKNDTSNLRIDDQVTPEQQENLSYNEAELLFLLGKAEYPGTFYDIAGTDGVVSVGSNPMLVFYKQQHPEWKNADGDNLFQKYERSDISSDDKADLDAKIKKAPGEYFFAYLRNITDEETHQSNNPERVKELVEEIRSNPALPKKLIIKPPAEQEIEPVEDLVNALTLSEEENEQETLLGEESTTEGYFGCTIL